MNLFTGSWRAPTRSEVNWKPAGTRNLRSVLHIGADKCGSSSIQSFLSHHCELTAGPNNSKLTYACLSKNGLKTSERIEKNLRKSVSGYINSLCVNKLNQIPARRLESIRDSVNSTPGDLIFSCEGWLRALSRPQSFRSVLDLVAPPGSHRDVELIAFVRAPAKWINSAWWQWGIWEPDRDFESWLDTAIGAVQWHKYLHNAYKYQSVKKLTVQPIGKDVVCQLIDILDIKDIKSLRLPSNQSLPAEALMLFAQHRQHRPNAHSSFNDFLIGHAISANANQYSRTPWVLNPSHIQRILEATQASNYQLLELMDEPSKQCVLNDPHWWTSEAYASLSPSDPIPQLDPAQSSAYQLASDLFQSLGEAVKILRARGLLKNYLEAIQPSDVIDS